jgi:hypothetical protein
MGFDFCTLGGAKLWDHDLDQRRMLKDHYISLCNFEGKAMMWNATAIMWDQQVLLMWILLPPVFIACGFLALVVPLYLDRRNKVHADEALSGPALSKSRV